MATLIFRFQAVGALLLIGGLAPIAGFAADTVSPQQDDNLETVVVTGMVGSINRSIGIKHPLTKVASIIS